MDYPYIKSTCLALKENLLTHWQRLAAREKKAVALGGAVLFCFFIYAGLWLPYITHIANLREHIQAEQKTLSAMQFAVTEIKQLQSQQQSHQALSIMGILSELQMQIAASGLASQITELKQSNNDSIALGFHEVDFDKFMRLLIEFNKKQALKITAFSVSASAVPGFVDMTMTIHAA